ncbi:hypothetical protein ADK43_30595 [Streptomyces rimosus subsp. rimosus]|nr:hypothetical protein ADK43_30595 [Streptomyces rimosus subsp. rimosus]
MLCLDLIPPTSKRKGQKASVASIYRALAEYAKREAYGETVEQAYADFASPATSLNPWVRRSASGPSIRKFGGNTRVLCKPQSFGRDIGVDLCRCSIAVFENVVLVVQLGESLGQRQLVPEALVNPEGQLTWRQLVGQHPGGKCSCGGFLPGNTAHCVEGEAQFVECRGKEIGDVVARLHACARRQDL